MSYDQIGKLLIVVGVSMLLVGAAFLLLGRTGLLGRLPGDFTFSNGNLTCIVPIAAMIIISILLTIVLNVVLRLFNR